MRSILDRTFWGSWTELGLSAVPEPWERAMHPSAAMRRSHIFLRSDIFHVRINLDLFEKKPTFRVLKNFQAPNLVAQSSRFVLDRFVSRSTFIVHEALGLYLFLCNNRTTLVKEEMLISGAMYDLLLH